jgi:hypothetical protein
MAWETVFGEARRRYEKVIAEGQQAGRGEVGCGDDAWENMWGGGKSITAGKVSGLGGKGLE